MSKWFYLGSSASRAIPMPDQQIAFVRRQDRLVKVDDDGSVYIRSGSSMPWRELRAAKRALEG